MSIQVVVVSGDCDSDQGGSTQQCLNSRYILKVEPLGFPSGRHMGKKDSKVSGLRN